jgi:hypothetical protein
MIRFSLLPLAERLGEMYGAVSAFPGVSRLLASECATGAGQIGL